MCTSEIVATISLRSRGSSIAVPSKDARQSMSEQFTAGRLIWLPPDIDCHPELPGHSVSGTFWVYLAGLSFAALAKPILDGLLKEAGKDLWLALKKLVCRTREEQVKASYTVRGSAFVIIEINEQYVAIRFPFPDISTADKDYVRTIEAKVLERLTQLEKDWDSIQQRIVQFQVGKTNALGWSESGWHLIDCSYGDENLQITASPNPYDMS